VEGGHGLKAGKPAGGDQSEAASGDPFPVINRDIQSLRNKGITEDLEINRASRSAIGTDELHAIAKRIGDVEPVKTLDLRLFN